MTLNGRVLQLLQCKCSDGELFMQDVLLTCRNCGHTRPILNGSIIVDRDLEYGGVNSGAKPSQTHYEVDTKHRYQSVDYAKSYLNKYKGWYNPLHGYVALIARREQASVARLINQIEGEVDLLLDLPAGTGKLASVHQCFAYDVLAGDVSFEMLRVGMDEWQGDGRLLGFIQMDVTRTLLRDQSVDCVVCLRLMHRLNLEIIRKALDELKRIARRHLIISYGVSDFSLAGMLYRKGKKYSEHERSKLTYNEWHSLLSNYGTVKESRYVLRGVSKEVISLVEFKA